MFAKLKQGVQENEQLMTVARMRADAEDLYGQKLGDIEAATNKVEGGFQRDDGASTKKVSGLSVRQCAVVLMGVGVRGCALRDERGLAQPS